MKLFWSVRVDWKSHYNNRVSLHEAATKKTSKISFRFNCNRVGYSRLVYMHNKFHCNWLVREMQLAGEYRFFGLLPEETLALTSRPRGKYSPTWPLNPGRNYWKKVILFTVCFNRRILSENS